MKPSGTEQLNSLGGQDAVRAATVSDDVLVAGQFHESLFQLLQGDGHRSSDVSGVVFVGRTNINHHRFTGLDAAEEALSVHTVNVLPASEEGTLRSVDRTVTFRKFGAIRMSLDEGVESGMLFRNMPISFAPQ